MKRGLFDDDDDGDNVSSHVPSAVDNEPDELDMFMQGVETQVRHEETEPKKVRVENEGDEEDEEEVMGSDDDDMMESYASFRDSATAVVAVQDIEYDENGKEINYNDPSMSLDLPAVDHSKMRYEPFKKNIYVSTAAVNAEQIEKMRGELDVRVRADEGITVPPPATSLDGLGLGHTITTMLKKEFEAPTPIQAQTVPAALAGLDVIGIAKTGSGKTGAYLWPIIFHIANLPPPQERGSPLALVVAPTRELAKQICDVCKAWCKPMNFTVVNLLGGSGNLDQIQALRNTCEIVVGTPGRIIHFIKRKYLKVAGVRFLCLDEADKMLDLGFEGQVRTVCSQLRPDRLTLMFSATFKQNVQKLAGELLLSPVRINVGTIGAVNKDVSQIPIVVANDMDKKAWLHAKLPQLIKEGSVLIFVGQKQAADELADECVSWGLTAASTHGEKSQQTRNKIHFAFKNGNCPILIATDVASRGLDVGSVKTVIQVTAPKNLDVHTHRVGRTGRAGEKGNAYALISEGEHKFAKIVCASMQQANQLIPPDLRKVAGTGRDGGSSGKGGGKKKKNAEDAVWDKAVKKHESVRRSHLGFKEEAGGLGDRRGIDDSLGAAFASFKSSFVPEKKK